MIARLRGILIEKKPPYLVLEVQGVGYEVAAPMNTFYQLPDLHQELSLFIHPVIREDAHQLFGFYKEQERTLFRALIKVNGIGPKLALTILSGIEPHQLVRSVLEDDANSLTHIPGIGKKTAERLIIETRDALAHWTFEDGAPPIKTQDESPNSQKFQDAFSALQTLGYKPNEAKQLLTQVFEDHLSPEELIRLALKFLGKAKS
jgi:Holliday junction DNA helicase RuvA